METKSEKVIRTALCEVIVSIIICTVIFSAIIAELTKTSRDFFEDCGNTVYEKSSEYLTVQAEDLLTEYAGCSGITISEMLEVPLSALKAAASQVSDLYVFSGKYSAVTVRRPSALPPDTYCLKFTSPEKNITSGMTDELKLLGNIESCFSSTIAAHSEITSLAFASTSGIHIVYDDKAQNRSDYYDGRNYEWYIKVKELEKKYISDPFPDFYEGGTSVTAAMPCYGVNDEFIGVISADICLDDIENYIRRVNTDGAFDMYLISKTNIIFGKNITSRESGNTEQHFGSKSAEIIEKIYSSENGSFETEINGKEALCFYSGTEISDWKTVIILPQTGISIPSDILRNEVGKIRCIYEQDFILQFFRLVLFLIFAVIVLIVSSDYFIRLTVGDGIEEEENDDDE